MAKDTTRVARDTLQIPNYLQAINIHSREEVYSSYCLVNYV